MKKMYIAMVALLCSFAMQAQDGSMQASSFSTAAYMHEIPALSSMDNIISAEGFEDVAPPKRRGSNTFVPGKGLPAGPDPLARLQEVAATTAGRAPIVSFDAHLGTVLNDPTGAIGPNHYVYAFNSGFGILDRAGNVLLPEASLGTLFPGETLGDPVVVYDRFADRFIIMEFSNTPNGFLVAVCQGPDPVNDGWYTYRFNTGTFPDYEKMSVWGDGYYITANKNQGAQTTNDVVFALERDEMLVGNPSAQMIGFPLPAVEDNGFYSPGGFNTIGATLPPVGVPHPIVYMQDDAWSGISTDHLKVWNISTDWSVPSNSSISTPQQINTAPFDAVFNGGGFQNLDEPGSGPNIDAIQATMMYMTNYRRFGTHNSAVMNFVVDVSGNDTRAGIRWYELRQANDTAPWTIYQEGTYSQPNHSTFCASISMDSSGNIGLGYTIVSSSQYTSLRYTGRQATDPLGTMTVAETFIVDGDAQNNRSDGRYGDYSQLTVDPLDDETFWHIGEYMKGPSSTVRRSHVASFKIATGPPDTEAPTDPTSLAASGTTAISTDLNWTASTDNVAVVGYDVYQDGVNVATAGTNSYTVTGLSPDTAYSFYVIAKDAAGNQSGQSNTVNITTLDASGCTGGITGYPYNESFENTFGSWTQASGDDLNWSVTSGTTPSSGTGPSSANDGTYYIFVEASGDGTGYPNKQAVLNSPCFDLSSATSASVNFDVHQFGSSDMGSITLEASFDDGISWNSIWSQTGNQGDSWNSVSVDLAAYLGESVQFRLDRVTGGTWQADIAIDAFNVTAGTGVPDTEAPTAPSSLAASNTTTSTTDLNWSGSTDNVAVTGYNIYQDGGLIDTSASTSYTATGLSSATSYDFYVTAFDAAGNESAASNTVNITTETASSSVLSAHFFESGWDGWADGGSDSFRYSGTRSYEGSYSIRLRDNTSSSVMTSQTYDLTAYNSVDVEFFFYSWSMENGEDFWLQYDDGSGFTTVASYARGTSFENGSFYTATVNIDSGSYNLTSNARFRFRNDASGNSDWIYIDAVTITGNAGGARNNTSSEAVLVGPGPIEQALETYELADDDDIFTLYPNPVVSVLEIDTQGLPIDDIRVFNMFGLQVKQASSLEPGDTLNVSNLPIGTYFVRIVSGETTITRKFIKK
ncbi:MAG: fibronectin type III domain-containing protein [Gilvibacter sp.]